MNDGRPLDQHFQEIMNDVTQRISSSEQRSLWEKMKEELRNDGPRAVAGYLGDELDRCEHTFSRRLEELKDTYTQKRSS